jgi:hypothetical protein
MESTELEAPGSGASLVASLSPYSSSLAQRGVCEPPILFNIGIYENQQGNDRQHDGKDGPPLSTLPTTTTYRAWRFVDRGTSDCAVVGIVIEVVGHNCARMTAPMTDASCGCHAVVERHDTTSTQAAYVSVVHNLCDDNCSATQNQIFFDAVAAISGICSLTNEQEAWKVPSERGQGYSFKFPCVALHRGSMGIDEFQPQTQWSRVVNFTTRGRAGVYQSRIETAAMIDFSDNIRYPSRIVPCGYASHPQLLLARLLFEQVAAMQVRLLRLDVDWRHNRSSTSMMTVWEQAQQSANAGGALTFPAAVSFHIIPIIWTAAVAPAIAEGLAGPITNAEWKVTSP